MGVKTGIDDGCFTASIEIPRLFDCCVDGFRINRPDETYVSPYTGSQKESDSSANFLAFSKPLNTVNFCQRRGYHGRSAMNFCFWGFQRLGMSSQEGLENVVDSHTTSSS